jgi:hypothetical protein
MDDVERAVTNGLAVPNPETALHDSSLFSLALSSPKVGDDFANGIRRYLLMHRLDPQMVEMELVVTALIQNEQWDRLYASVRNAISRSAADADYFNDVEVRRNALGQAMAWWGALGGIVSGPITMLIASTLAGVLVRSIFNDIDKAQAIEECRERIQILGSLLRNMRQP